MPSLDALKRNRRLVFEQRTVTADAYNGDLEIWDEVFRAWASVRFDTATFTVLRSTQTQQISAAEHRFRFDGGIWDITAIVPSVRLNRGLDIGGIRRTQ